ncbi:MAG: YqgE/AlgH family protein [Nocardioidaceae bacterium]|nr:MAG: YqgE/AlgH family protein [Nocardioidaceae bacterium]
MLAELAAGRLLVATPTLLDPNFARTVALLLDVDETGALGVVLNRPSKMPVESILPEWITMITAPDVVFAGGPVSGDSALAVGFSPGSIGVESGGFRPVFGNVGIVDLDASVDTVAGSVVGVRVFAGYAGWGPGQLEGEIDEGAWYVLPATHADLFGDRPDRLWSEVLRRQPGELSWVSTHPLDPSQN